MFIVGKPSLLPCGNFPNAPCELREWIIVAWSSHGLLPPCGDMSQKLKQEATCIVKNHKFDAEMNSPKFADRCSEQLLQTGSSGSRTLTHSSYTLSLGTRDSQPSKNKICRHHARSKTEPIIVLEFADSVPAVPLDAFPKWASHAPATCQAQG